MKIRALGHRYIAAAALATLTTVATSQNTIPDDGAHNPVLDDAFLSAMVSQARAIAGPGHDFLRLAAAGQQVVNQAVDRIEEQGPDALTRKTKCAMGRAALDFTNATLAIIAASTHDNAAIIHPLSMITKMSLYANLQSNRCELKPGDSYPFKPDLSLT